MWLTRVGLPIRAYDLHPRKFIIAARFRHTNNHVEHMAAPIVPYIRSGLRGGVMDSSLLSGLLIENHLEFLAAHRAKVTRHADFHECVSDKDDFNLTLTLSVDGAIAAAARAATIHVPSWIYDETSAVLGRSHGETGHVVYMAVRIDWRPDRDTVPACFEVRSARTRTEIDDFAAAQTGGFCETPESVVAFGEWVRAADHRNAAEPRQRFFVGYLADRPVACALTLHAASIAGVYAVATLPEYRGRGYSRAVMEWALAESLAQGFAVSGLAVARGSDAHRLYLRLGYRPVFSMHVLSPEQKGSAG